MKNKQITVEIKRFATNDKATIGMLYIFEDYDKKDYENSFFCFTLEDENNDEKVAEETRIPAGIYDLGLRRSKSPMTVKYREKYKWFKHFIKIKNVRQFEYIYLHIGNNEKHTAGCILLGFGADLQNLTLSNSTEAMKLLYKRLYKKIDAGKKVNIIIN